MARVVPLTSGSDSSDDGEDSYTAPKSLGGLSRSLNAAWRRSTAETFNVNFQDIDATKARHRVFFSNCQLALCVAVACTLFGVPTYSKLAKATIFGQKECGQADIYRRLVLDNGTLTHWEVGTSKNNTIWCGYMPTNYKDQWPNLIQMIVFTAYRNTGTTMMQAWQGSIGTGMAVLNIYIMDWLYPNEQVTWVAWVNAFGFILLVLLSGSAENTMKFAMSWHVFFMMTFLNPNLSNPDGSFPTGLPRLSWDQYTVSVLITAFLGCAVAVIATVVPNMLLNYKNVVSDAESTQKAIAHIWTEAIDYFCGSRVFVKRYVIAEAITNINTTIDGVQSNLQNSWWETFDFGGFGKKRMLYNIYDTTLQRMAKIMVAVQDSVVTEDFSDGHKEFCDSTHASMISLKNSAAELLEKCQQACQDGDIDADEVDEIEEGVTHVKECQAKLLKAFKTVANGKKDETVCPHLTNENEFCFMLSVWARKIVDCAESMVEADTSEGQTFCGVVVQGFCNTWKFPSRAKLLWAMRNFISIASAFWIGYQMPCWGVDAYQAHQVGGTKECSDVRYRSSLFTPYDANMANTLGLLINHYPGAALINNIQRLLGVVMGKVIPMVIQGAIAIAGLHELGKTLAIAISLFLFTWLSNYMYYSSRNWAIVGCLMAGFGCSLLSHPMREEDFEDYNPNYKELAQVVIAICFQITIDTFFDWIQDDWPRDGAVKKVREIKNCVKNSFSAFFEGDLDGLLKANKDVRGLVNAAKGLSHEVDPSLQLTPGFRSDFKVDLYRDALVQLELLSSDLMMLIMATKCWKADPTPKDGNDKSALEEEPDSDSEDEEKRAHFFDTLKFLHGLDAVVGKGGLKEELVHYIDVVLESLEAMLNHGSEDNNFQEASKTQELITLRSEGFTRLREMYDEINQRKFGDLSVEDCVCEDPHAKVAMAVRSLVRAKAHVGEIMKLMMPYIRL